MVSRGIEPRQLNIGQLGFGGRYHYRLEYTPQMPGPHQVRMHVVPRPGGDAADPYPDNNTAEILFYVVP